MVFDPSLATLIAGDVALVFAAVALGIMLFFGAGVAPAALRTLDKGATETLMHALFPHYYLSAGSMAVLAAIAAVPVSRLATLLLFLTAVGFLWLRQALMPRIERLREEGAAGNANARIHFARLNRLSLRLNMIQLVMIVGAVVVLIGD